MNFLLLASVFGISYLVLNQSPENQDTPSNSPQDFDPLYKKYASQYVLDWKMLKAIAMIESQNGQATSVSNGISNPTDVSGSVSSDGKSWGLMQLTVPTANDFEAVTPVELNNPETSVRIAAKYFAWLEENYFDPEDTEALVRAYNGGHNYSVALTTPYFNKYVSARATL